MQQKGIMTNGLPFRIIRRKAGENLFYFGNTHIYHIAHVIQNIAPDKIENVWISNSMYGNLSLKDMVEDFPRHFRLHLEEIDKLLEK